MLPDNHLLCKIVPVKPLPLIMGIINVTPDSFSDGRKYFNLTDAVAKAESLIEDGADLLDIGGESTRPGAKKVDAAEEISRVIPVIKAIRKISRIPISVDTRKSEVAKPAIDEGANIINDISALRYDPAMAKLLSGHPAVGVIIMHMAGEPENMQDNPAYDNVLNDITKFLLERAEYCRDNGISQERLILDPGIGFGKTLEHNLTILANIDIFVKLQYPIIVGASRKSFIHAIAPTLPFDRLPGSLAATQACLDGKVELIRVHDVREQIQFISVYQAITARKSK